MNMYEREEQNLEEMLANEEITLAEYNEQMRELQRDRRDAAHEAAQSAYDAELERW